MNYIFALDLSIANSGIAVFDENSFLEHLTSVKTNPKQSHGVRLNQIANKLIELRCSYPTNLIVIERAFSQHNTATQVLYRVHGLINYLFYDCEQIYYAPTTIKQTITGSGKSDKSQVQAILQELNPEVKFKNNDESDAVAIGLTYFIKKGVLTPCLKTK
jgi:Holliday junction resolvasome RuvABC endonuclease subunit